MPIRLSKEEQAQILEKIRKLLALSESPNEHEAALAAARARALLDKYDLSMDEVDIKAEEVLLHTVSTGTRKPYPWMGHLAADVGYAFNCRVFRAMGSMIFCGIVSDTKVAEYVYVYLLRTVRRLHKEHKATLEKSGEWESKKGVGARVYMQSYDAGLVRAVSVKLNEFVSSKDRQESLGSIGKELMVVKFAKVDDFVKRTMGKARPGRQSQARLNTVAFGRGWADGSEKIQINRGIPEK